MKYSLSLVLLLSQVARGLAVEEQKVLTSHETDDIDSYEGANHDRPQTYAVSQESITPPQPGDDLVDVALERLRKLPQQPYRRRKKTSSIFSYIFDFALQAIPSFRISAPPNSKKSTTSTPLDEVVSLLEQAAQVNNSDALYLLAEMNFYGNYSHPLDLASAYQYYDRLASIYGNTTAQFMLGVYHSTGVGGVVPRDQAKALLYYTFAAVRGETRAEMAVAFRHHIGIGSPKNCEVAAKYYKRVADKAMTWYRSGPPGGMAWVQQSWRIADDNGGAYGHGASAASSGLNAMKSSVSSDNNAAIEDVIEYLDLVSQKGDSKASYNLGRLYYDGQRGLERDLELARKYFFVVARRFWRKDGRILDNYKAGVEKIAAKAAGFLGRMYLRGDGVTQNFEKAKIWFERGSSQGDAQSQHGLGLMHLNGYGVTKNVGLATELFRSAADQDYAPAQVELGVLYLDQGGAEDVRIASNYFELAARYGNIESNYYLAEMIFHGVGRDRACGMALQYYKGVAEKAEPLVSSWATANEAYEDGDIERALVHYVVMAEQGYERAQNNVAYLLDPNQSRLPLSLLLASDHHPSQLMNNASLALVYWTRSSKQGNIDSMVKMGDYYFYGIGVDADLSKAVQCYTGASDYSQSAQALYNLGWMHENGIGLTQDFHLAKRYYDQALEVNEEAYLPVTLSLLKLRARSAWNTFTHGPVHSIQDDPKPKKDWSLGEWITNFLQDDGRYYEDGLYDDMFDDNVGTGTGDFDDEDDGLLETLAIIGLTAMIVGLLYYRQIRQQVHREQEDARRQQQRAAQGGEQAAVPEQPRGVFPQPGEPDFANWVAGGVGH